MTKWGLYYAHKADAFAYTERWRDDCLQILHRLPKQGTIVDFACNTGRFIGHARVYSPQAKFVGIDLNEWALDIARRQNLEPVARKNPAAFFDSIVGIEADYVVMMHCLPQFEKPEETLAEIWSALKPGGGISVVIHNRLNDYLWAVPNLFNGYKADETITKNYSLNELKSTMKDAGFLCDEAYAFGSEWLPDFVKPRLAFHGRRPA
jgi:SAM-dependent methyltransferase